MEQPIIKESSARMIQRQVLRFLRRKAIQRTNRAILRRNAAAFIEKVWLTYLHRQRTLGAIREVRRRHRIDAVMRMFYSKCKRKVLQRQRKNIGAVIRIQYFIRKQMFGFPYQASRSRFDNHTQFLQSLARRAVLSGKKTLNGSKVTPDQVMRCVIRIQSVFRAHRVRHQFQPILRQRWSAKMQELDQFLLSTLRKKYYLEVGRLIDTAPRPYSASGVGHNRGVSAVAANVTANTSPGYEFEATMSRDTESDVASSVEDMDKQYIRPNIPQPLRNPCKEFIMRRRWAMMDRDVDTETLRASFTHCVTRKPWVSTLHIGKVEIQNRNRLTALRLRPFGSACGTRIRTPSVKSEVPSIIRGSKPVLY